MTYTYELIQLLSKLIWVEIEKQSVRGSGIHLSVQIYPDGDLVIVADTEKKGKRYSKEYPITISTIQDFLRQPYSMTQANIELIIKELILSCKNVK